MWWRHVGDAIGMCPAAARERRPCGQTPWTPGDKDLSLGGVGMSRHAIRSFTWLLLAIVLNGCLSLSYHAKELSNRCRPCLFPGFMYYLRGTDKNFLDAYLDELRTNIPLGAFLPVLMLGDLCVDVVFLPLDGVLVANSDSDFLIEPSKDGGCLFRLPGA